jgi:hypothetical protein
LSRDLRRRDKAGFGAPSISTGAVAAAVRSAHEMPVDAAFDLIGQMPIRLTNQALDFPLHAAVTRLLGAIANASQCGAKALTNSPDRHAAGTVPLHASGYRGRIFQLKTKLNDGAIVCGDNDPHELARAKPKGVRRAPIVATFIQRRASVRVQAVRTSKIP